MPYHENQLNSGEWNENIVLKKDFKKDKFIENDLVHFPEMANSFLLKKAIHQERIALCFFNQAEYSHHYGIKKI